MRFFTKTRCIDGRLWRHDPMYDDPDLETEIGECEECGGLGKGLDCADTLIEERNSVDSGDKSP